MLKSPRHINQLVRTGFQLVADDPHRPRQKHASLLRLAAHGDAVRRVGVRRRMGPDRRRRPGSGNGVSRAGARRGRPCPTPARQNAPRLPAGQPMTTERPALPVPAASAEVPAHLEKLVEIAKDYARGAKAAATLRAYAADWRHFTAWCRRRGLDPELEALPPDPQV